MATDVMASFVLFHAQLRYTTLYGTTMALSLVELLVLPHVARDEKDILLNIPSFKRKCDLFYHLSDKEAYQLIEKSELHQYSPDFVIPEADTNLCILISGKVSLCHKILNLPKRTTFVDQEPEEQDEKNMEGKNKMRWKLATSPTKEHRRITVVEMVDQLLSQRKKTMQDDEARLGRITPIQPAGVPGADADALLLQDMHAMPPTRTELYGKSTLQHSAGGCFGGENMLHRKTANKNDQYVYVADKECYIIVIPLDLQDSIVDTHYENNIKDKEKLIRENPVAKHITAPQKQALGHEILEQHFVHGNTLVTRGQPSSTVFLITSGFARLYMRVQIPRETLSPAVQHLPSTKLRQRMKTIETEVLDIGPGEFVGGLEQLFDTDKYLFTVRATTKIVAYNMRSEQFKELFLKPGTKSLQTFTENLKKKFELRSQICDFTGTEDVDEIISELLEVKKRENLPDPMDILKTDMFRARSKKCIPAYMQTSEDENNKKIRITNRGPLHDRVRKRMIELGFKSRRGT